MQEKIGMFRGKRANDDNWTYGDLIQLKEDAAYWYIFPKHGRAEIYERDLYPVIGIDILCEITLIRVLPETVSEYTCLEDINFNHIYEHDILSITTTVRNPKTDEAGHVIIETREDYALVLRDYKTGGWRLKVYHNGKYKRISNFTKGKLVCYHAKIVGNIWDNPELLERSKR